MIAIRTATDADAAAIQAIYAPIVEQTAISFETEPPGSDEMAERIRDALDSHAYVVAEDNGTVLGYAYGSTFRPRAAYASTCEVTAYVAEGARGQGIGKLLYKSLIPVLARRDFRTAIAGIALPNDASIALHEAMGFEKVGILREVGRKFDRWHDVGWWSLSLKDISQ